MSLNLPSNACGVRTSTINSTVEEPDDNEDLYYTVELVIQMDRQLQQSSDQELMVRWVQIKSLDLLRLFTFAIIFLQALYSLKSIAFTLLSDVLCTGASCSRVPSGFTAQH